MSIPPGNADRISPGEPIIPGRPTNPTTPTGGQSSFESRMGGTPGSPQATPPQSPSPAEVTRGPGGTPSMDSLVSQVGTMQDSMGNLHNQLKTKNLTLNRSQQHLLRNKLSDASDHLRAVNGKLGVETPPMNTPKGGGPIERFLSFVTDGEKQMNAAKAQLESIKASDEPLNPSDLMLLQIKLNQAQQEIEYSSILLGKVITAMTQILNTQL